MLPTPLLLKIVPAALKSRSSESLLLLPSLITAAQPEQFSVTVVATKGIPAEVYPFPEVLCITWKSIKSARFCVIIVSPICRKALHHNFYLNCTVINTLRSLPGAVATIVTNVNKCYDPEVETALCH